MRLAGLGLRRVFDFRTLADIETDGADRLPEGTEHLRLPMPDPARSEDLRIIVGESAPAEMEKMFGDGKAASMMARSAAGLVRERCEPYRIFLAELAREEAGPALFHCSAGKDRAGWAGTLVLLTLGVEEEQVVEQYLLSNRDLEGIRRRLVDVDQIDWADLLAPFLEVRREYIESSFAAVSSDWGSFDRYLHEGLGITPEQREQIRASLLE